MTMTSLIKNNYMAQILGFVEPHKNISRLVTQEDLPQVLKDAEAMAKLLNAPIGVHNGFYAIAHPQCEKDRPLRFFIVNPKTTEFRHYKSIVIINPVILRHTGTTIDSQEGCASFPNIGTTVVKRFNKCEIEFSPLEFDKDNNPILGKRITINLTSKASKVWQHEIDHLNAKYIY